MKELDLLLRRYLDLRWPQAPDGEKAAFEAFLELPDPVIASYLLGHAHCPDAGVQGLVEALRASPAPGPAQGMSPGA
jgi:succinate dehydrogenase flavin-adding protein (antitoxin of CptAB toxin-antitoxin module)